MKLKNNNMLIAGDFFEQTAKIYPESIDNKDDLKQSERDYKPIVEEIKKINPDFQFDYSSYPALTILDKDNNALAFGVHPDVRISFLGEYACANGIFNSAFENKKLFDDVAKAMAVMGGDVQALSIRNDLGEEYQQVAKNMLRAVLDGTQNPDKFNYLNELYVSDEKLAENFEVYREERNAMYLARVREKAYVMYGNPDKESADLKEQHEQAKAESVAAAKAVDENVDADLADELNQKQALADENLETVTDKVKERLKLEDEAAAAELDWHEERMKEFGFKFKVSKRPVYKNAFPNIQDVVVADENQNELYRFRSGLSPNVKISPAGLMNPNARAIAQEYIIRKGVSPIKINLPDLDSNSGLSNAELMTFLKSSAVEFHENFGVPFDKLRVPSSYKEIFKEFVNEYEAKKALESGYETGNDEPEPASPAPVAVDSPSPAEPVADPVSEHEIGPVEGVEGVEGAEPVQVVVDPQAAPVPAMAAPGAAPSSIKEPVKEPVKSVEIAVSQGLWLVESKKQEGKFVVWGKSSFEHTDESLKKGISGLCKHHGIEPEKIIGQWKTNDVKASLNPKKSGDFINARTVLSGLVQEQKAAEKVEAPKTVKVDKPDLFAEFDLDEKEKAIAEAMGTPEILDSTEQAERVAIRNEEPSSPVSVGDELDSTQALNDFNDMMKKVDDLKKNPPVQQNNNVQKIKV
ncbi:TPA: hypothetical protein SMW33_004508 [Pseudomonas aeruginosa]|nr:hypothetical protein [Pseudomonas aeruginosa]HEK3577560.1 hypothetical protein [Pseudomonas aeruginosa]HEK3590449.1 hypothetical protein [Pseudomonas aeruginosa]